MSIKSKIELNFFNLFKIFRGASVESGGNRELSSGILSDRIREKSVGIVFSLSGRILEVGCGEGLFLEKVSSAAHQRHFGVELAPTMLRRSIERFSEDDENTPFFLIAQGEFLPFAKDSFDHIICVNTLHNQKSIINVRSILIEMSRVCKPGGSIIFDIRNRFNPLMYFAYRFANFYDSTCKNIPLNTFSVFDIQKNFKTVDFTIVKKIPVMFPSAVYHLQ